MFNYSSILVVGASSGIGQALAEALYNLPHKPHIILASRNANTLSSFASSLGPRASYSTVDVGYKAQGGDQQAQGLKQWVERIVKEYPELDCVIYASGVQHTAILSQPESEGRFDLDLFQDEFQVNYHSYIALLKFLLPHFLSLDKPSCIVPITSTLASVPFSRVPNYCASKAAVHSFSMSLRAHLEAKGTKIKVREIYPPLVESSLHDHQGTTALEGMKKVWMPLKKFTEETIKKLIQTDDDDIPVGNIEKSFAFEVGKSELVKKFEEIQPAVD